MCHLSALGSGVTDGVKKGAMVERLKVAAGGSWGHVASYWASLGHEGSAPKCVCSAPLTRISRNERMGRWVESDGWQRGTAEFEREVKRRQDRGMGILCDICDERVPCDLATWTCQAGSKTVLHARSYDVC